MRGSRRGLLAGLLIHWPGLRGLVEHTGILAVLLMLVLCYDLAALFFFFFCGVRGM